MKEDKERAKQSWAGRVRNIVSDVCSIDVYSFDFEQNLPCPNIQSSEVFYMHQMWLYNFGVHDNVDETATMMVWAENQGKHGSSEVASCLKTIFDSRKFGAKHLILWSDGCAGQNKNHTMTGFLISLVKNGEYCSIDHKFLIRGHTYLPNDRDFAQIEKQKPTAQVNLPQDWIPYIQNAKRKNPFSVISMTWHAFRDYKTFSSQTFKQLKKTTSKETVRFRAIQWFSYGESYEEGEIKSHCDEVWFRYSLDVSEPWKKVKVVKGTFGEPQKQYDDEVALKAAKISDLVKLANKFLPPSPRSYYLNLRSASHLLEKTDDYGNECED